MHRSSGLFFAAYKPASGFADQPKASKWDAVRWESLAQIHCWEENHDAEFVEARVTPTWNSMADCGKGVLGQGHGEVGSAPQNSLCQYLVRRRHLLPPSKELTEVLRRQKPFDLSGKAAGMHRQASKWKREAKTQLAKVQPKKQKTK